MLYFPNFTWFVRPSVCDILFTDMVNVILWSNTPNRRFLFYLTKLTDIFTPNPLLYTVIGKKKYETHVSAPRTFEVASQKIIIDNLPIIGYLEQTIVVLTNQVLIKLTAMKPIYPRLSTKL